MLIWASDSGWCPASAAEGCKYIAMSQEHMHAQPFLGAEWCVCVWHKQVAAEGIPPSGASEACASLLAHGS